MNADIRYSAQPLELRNQRVYAVKVSQILQQVKKHNTNSELAGVNGFLDVARQNYKESNEDALQLVNNINGEHVAEIVINLLTVPRYVQSLGGLEVRLDKMLLYHYPK